MRVLLLALIFFLAPAAYAASLTVTVTNVDPKGGMLRVSLYDEAGWSKDEDTPVASDNLPALVPETKIVLTGVKPGVYGIKLFQDFNSNGKFDQNFLGLPLERYGFSRDARPFLSQPRFGRTKFTIAEGANEIVIRLQ